MLDSILDGFYSCITSLNIISHTTGLMKSYIIWSDHGRRACHPASGTIISVVCPSTPGRSDQINHSYGRIMTGQDLLLSTFEHVYSSTPRITNLYFSASLGYSTILMGVFANIMTHRSSDYSLTACECCHDGICLSEVVGL